MTADIDLAIVREVAATPPIFVAGSVRSGTTLVRSILDAHPAISVTYETGFAVDIALGGPGSGDMSAAIERLVAHPAFRFLDVPFDATRTREILSDLEPADVTDLVRLALALRAVAHGKRRFGDKTPRYAFHLQALQRLYPDARLVLVMRDGREAAASAARTTANSAAPRSILLDAVLWRSSARRAFETLAKMSPDVLCMVKLEELIASPEETARRLCSFVGEEFDMAMLSHHETARERLPLAEKEFSNLHSGVTRNVGETRRDWREGVSPTDAEAVEVLLRSNLKRFGYEVPQRPRSLAAAKGWARVGTALARELPANAGSLANHLRRELTDLRQRAAHP